MIFLRTGFEGMLACSPKRVQYHSRTCSKRKNRKEILNDILFSNLSSVLVGRPIGILICE